MYFIFFCKFYKCPLLIRKEHNSLRMKYFVGVLIIILPSINKHQIHFMKSPAFLKSILKEFRKCPPTATNGIVFFFYIHTKHSQINMRKTTKNKYYLLDSPHLHTDTHTLTQTNIDYYPNPAQTNWNYDTLTYMNHTEEG